MVTLLKLISLRKGISLLTTGVPLLDSTIFGLKKLDLYDFQCAPGTLGMTSVLVEMMISHLVQNTENRVVMVETLVPFPWLQVKRHPRYTRELLENGLLIYDAPTFSQLYAIFASKRLAHLQDDALYMVIIYNYHELLELYKLELFATYEEALLKHHIHRNDVFLNNSVQLETTGKTTPIPELPPDSGLLRSSPISKFETHVRRLVQSIHKFSLESLLLCILAGGVDAKYHIPQTPPSSLEVSSNSPTPPPTSFKNNGRMILTSFTGTTDYASLERCIKTRLLFYKTWYHNTPAFKSSYTAGPREIKLVQAVRVDDFYKQKSSVKYFEDCENDDNTTNSVREIGSVLPKPNDSLDTFPTQQPAFIPAATSTQQQDVSDSQQSIVEDTDDDDTAIL